MGLLIEHIQLIEGEKEMATIISTMRRLGKDVDEVRQYLEKSTGKKLADISDQELAQMAAKGAAAGQQKLSPDARLNPALDKDYKDLQTALEIPGGKYLAAPKVRSYVPSGTYRTQSPTGEPIDIDVDISASDLGNIYSALKGAGKTFPKALDDLRKGNIGAALQQTIKRTLEPSPPEPTKPTSKGNWNQNK